MILLLQGLGTREQADAIDAVANGFGFVVVFAIALILFIPVIIFYFNKGERDLIKKEERGENGEHKESYNEMVRPRYRYLFGVCEAIGRKYKTPPVLIRFLFIVTVFFAVPSWLVYAILCFTIKNYNKVDLK